MAMVGGLKSFNTSISVLMFGGLIVTPLSVLE